MKVSILVIVLLSIGSGLAEPERVVCLRWDDPTKTLVDGIVRILFAKLDKKEGQEGKEDDFSLEAEPSVPQADATLVLRYLSTRINVLKEAPASEEKSAAEGLFDKQVFTDQKAMTCPLKNLSDEKATDVPKLECSCVKMEDLVKHTQGIKEFGVIIPMNQYKSKVEDDAVAVQEKKSLKVDETDGVGGGGDINDNRDIPKQVTESQADIIGSDKKKPLPDQKDLVEAQNINTTEAKTQGSPLIKDDVKPETLQDVSPEKAKGVSAESINGMTPEDLKLLDTKTITPEDISKINADKLVQFSAEQFNDLSDDQIKELQPAQKEALKGIKEAGALLERIDKLLETSANDNTQRDGITTSPQMSQDQKQQPNKDDKADKTDPQPVNNGLDDQKIKDLTKDQVTAMTSKDPSELTDENIGKLSAAQILGLDPSKIPVLTDEQIKVLDLDGADKMSADQLIKLTVKQIKTLSKDKADKIIAIVADETKFGAEELAALKATTARKLTDSAKVNNVSLASQAEKEAQSVNSALGQADILGLIGSKQNLARLLVDQYGRSRAVGQVSQQSKDNKSGFLI